MRFAKILKNFFICVLVVILTITSIPLTYAVDKSELVYGQDDTITRSEWVYDLTVIFEMYVDMENMPDNYYTDIDEEHKYYYEILSAVEYGVIDIEAGNPFYPDNAVTRDFAVSTLNYCLGFQLADGTEYTFSDFAECSVPDSAQIALDRGWLTPVSGNFAPETPVNKAEIEKMFDDAIQILEDSAVDENYEGDVEFEDDVVVLPEETQATVDENGLVSIADCPVEITKGTKFAVYYDNLPVVYQAESVEIKENITEIQSKTLDASEGFKKMDVQGVASSEVMEIIPIDDAEISINDTVSAISTFATKKLKSVDVDKKVNIGDGISIGLDVGITNPQIEYKLNANSAYVAFKGETLINYRLDVDLASMAFTSKEIPLFKANVFGVGSFTVYSKVAFDGSLYGTVSGSLVAGIECVKGGSIRTVRSFQKHGFVANAEAEAAVCLGVKFGVTEISGINAYVFAEMGAKAKTVHTTYSSGSPRTCQHYSAFLFVRYGANANVEIGIKPVTWEASINMTTDVYTESNSPLKIVHHYEDGMKVYPCSRGNTYYGFFTKLNSRWNGCGWLGGNGAYGLDGEGKPLPVYEYTLDENNNATITKYNYNYSSVSIPSEIDGYKVVAIGNNVFENKSMFYLSIPDSVITIGNSAFGGCKNLTTVMFGNSLTTIGENAFNSCISLRSVDIPDSVTKIGGSAFDSCRSLRKIKLSDAVTEIGGRAFAYTAINSINIPDSLENCGISLWRGIYDWSYDFDGTEYTIRGGIFHCCENLKNITFENKIDKIPANLFAGCTGLESVIIPDSVREIGNDAFKTCLRLRNVTIGKGTTIVKNGAFYMCVSLENLSMPDILTTIENMAFDSCISLKKVTLPKGLSFLGGRAFGNTALETLEIPLMLKDCSIELNRGIWDYDTTFEGATYSTRGGPFYLCKNLKTVTFAQGRKIIPEQLFAGCTGLETIKIPDTVETIEAEAFKDCFRLKKVEMNKTVKTIGNKAFEKCLYLSDITFPDTLESAGAAMFYNCVALTKFELPDSLKKIGDSFFENCKALETVKLPAELEYIGSKTFQNCESLTKIEIPASVTKLYGESFNNCKKLESVTFGKNSKLTELYNNVFKDCSALKDIVLPESVTRLNDGVFRNCVSLEKINIPQNTTYLGAAVFIGCLELTDVDFADFSVKVIKKETFKDCPKLNNVELPKGLTAIEDFAFANDTSLTDITIYGTTDKIAVNSLSYPFMTTISGQTGSYAETFANDNGFTFKDILPAECTHEEVIAFGATESTCTKKGSSGDIYCKICGILTEAKHELPYAEHTVIVIEGTPATCTQSGLSNGEKCSVCNKTLKYQSTIAPTGHTHGDWEVKTPPEIGIEGLEVLKCTTCGETIEERIIPALPEEPEIPEYIPGDVNGDNEITASDARIALRISAGIETLESTNALFAIVDFNGDGEITASDARKILRKSAGLE